VSDVAEAPEVVVDHVQRGDAITRVTHVDGDGDSPGRAFVLVAGIGVAATYFEFLAPTLAQQGDVYALDLPGFAGMPKTADAPTPQFFADQVEAVLEHYGLERPVIIGHSMGTQVVTEVLRRRHDVEHAVLVSPVVDEREATALRQGVRFAQAATHETLHLAVTAFAAYLLCGVSYFLRVLPHMLRYRMVERLPDVPARILFIRGEFDRVSPRRFHSRLVAAARDGSRWEIEGSAHSVLNAHALGVAELTRRHVEGSLSRKGRMPSDVADVPPPRSTDARVVISAMRTRVVEWFCAARGDEAGVARAKERHAELLWMAYTPQR
jgi:pimeloyl-ACP methyl ester carboxylesterase